uniref:Importin N-terminal domain-containing protein n=1 Tax=Rhabditophanes sp. KR3021 TaxID=114890 RepID=A0AC35U8E7_9BILA
MEWVPLESDLTQVLNLLSQSGCGSTEVQKDVQDQLDKLSKHSDFALYLAYVMSEMQQVDENSRSVSGIILKNILKIRWKQIPANIQEYVKEKSLKSVIDPHSPIIRATAGSIITTIFSNDEGRWIPVIYYLIEVLQRENVCAIEGALGAMSKICEDSSTHLEEKEILSVVPLILHFFKHEKPNFRGSALSIINNILLTSNETMLVYFDHFISALFGLSNDNDPEVVKQLCKCLTLICESFLDKIEAQMHNIIPFMILKTQDSDEDIALEACEFWLALTDHSEKGKTMITPILSQLLPILLKCMKYTKNDIMALKGDIEDDCFVPDRDEDIKPRFHKAKTHTLDHSENGMSNSSQKGSSLLDTSDNVDDDEYDEDCNSDWSLRKCAAATLDVISSLFGAPCLEFILKELNLLLFHEKWEYRESGILSLGAISEGCIQGIIPHLEELFPYLMKSLTDKKALIRSITCWTLSRYCQFIVQDPNSAAFAQLLNGLLERMLDSNKKVQKTACSAFAQLEEDAGKSLTPYLSQIVDTICVAFTKYQAKNLHILYDAISTLADNVGNNLNTQCFTSKIMPILMEKWSRIDDDDRELYSLLECLSSIANALHQDFFPYSEAVFQRCIFLISKSLYENPNGTSAPLDYGLSDREFVVVSLDLLSELTEALGYQVKNLIADSNLIAIVYNCIKDDNDEVRQSSLALLGDIAKICPELIKPMLHEFSILVIQNFDSKNTSLMNNAIWAFGVLATLLQNEVIIYIMPIMPQLVNILNVEKSQRTVLENTAITIGRLGQFAGVQMSPYLASFLKNWCLAIRNIRDNEEKRIAFEGLLCIIYHNPSAVLTHFIFFVDALCCWNNPPPDMLRNTIIAVS